TGCCCGRQLRFDHGRPISPDRAGYRPDVNRYRFCHNDPVNRIDPSGRGPSVSFSVFGKKFTLDCADIPDWLRDLAPQAALDECEELLAAAESIQTGAESIIADPGDALGDITRSVGLGLWDVARSASPLVRSDIDDAAQVGSLLWDRRRQVIHGLFG